MNMNRRAWINRLLGAVSLTAIWQGAVRGQAGQAKPSLSGRVCDTDGVAIAGLVVEIAGPDGAVLTDKTGKDGSYRLDAPKRGPYTVVFRESQGYTHVLDVRQLTAAANQILSVTIEPIKSFRGAYGALQAAEAVLMNSESSKAIPVKEIQASVAAVVERAEQSSFSRAQRQIFSNKLTFVQQLLKLVG